VIRVGLTGGIGSGKSTVAQIFEVLGIPVFYADTETRRLMNTDDELKKRIIEKFGKESYKDGGLNRSYIASIVFNDTNKLDLLNSLTHPALKKNGEKWITKQTTLYAIHEAALIFEAAVAERLDYVIGVYAPQHLRIKRVMERDNKTREDVLKRMNHQIDEEMKMKLCDFVITNDEQQLLVPQVIKLHEQFIQMKNL
jgi:dephospho-CoA kinase